MHAAMASSGLATKRVARVARNRYAVHKHRGVGVVPRSVLPKGGGSQPGRGSGEEAWRCVEFKSAAKGVQCLSAARERGIGSGGDIDSDKKVCLTGLSASLNLSQGEPPGEFDPSQVWTEAFTTLCSATPQTPWNSPAVSKPRKNQCLIARNRARRIKIVRRGPNRPTEFVKRSPFMSGLAF